MNRRGIVWLALSFAALPAPPILSALAQSGIIRVIIGTVPGGAIDPYARMIAEHMSRTLGQPIIVHAVDVLDLGHEQLLDHPRADRGVRRILPQVLELARVGFQMNEKFDLDLTHVPYRGSGLQVTGLLGGHSLFGFAQVNSSLAHVRSGKLKALATTGPTRDRSMPQVPTFAELGYPDFTAKVWFGLLVKEGVPEDVFKRLTEAAKAAHADPAVKAKLEAQGFEVSGETGPQLKSEIKQQLERWGRLVKASGFSIEDRGSTQ